MKVTDNTSGIKLNENREIELTVEFNNGSRYSYSGQLKKECLKQFKQKFGNFKGVISKEWNVYDSELIGYVESN